VVECLPDKLKALSSTPVLPQKKNERKEGRKERKGKGK
jgi:hypothetical protein